jgi:hypothetical protein
MEGWSMVKPTLEEYNQAKTDIIFAQRALRISQAKRTQLRDQLEKENNLIEKYFEMFDKSEDIVFLYEYYNRVKGD